jgi:hypothetical protein
MQRGTGYIDKIRLKNHNLEIEFKSKTDYIDGLQLADILAYRGCLTTRNLPIYCQSGMIDPPINQWLGGTSILACHYNNEL